MDIAFLPQFSYNQSRKRFRWKHIRQSTYPGRNAIENRNGGADDISDLKMQKLLYYAQGMSLAMCDTPMFEDTIEAWQHVPVVPSVYRIYKKYGAKGIPYSDDNAPKEDYTSKYDEVLETVYNYFGQFSAWKLRNMTHDEYPWKNTPLNSEITQDSIKAFFMERYIDHETV